MDTDKPNKRNIDSRWISVAIAVVYGVLTRISFGLGANNGLLSTLSWGFLTLVPLAIGGLSVFFAPPSTRYDYGYAIGASVTSSAIFLAIALVAAFEVFICILMAAPIFFIVSIIGGSLMCLVLRQSNRNYLVLLILLILPYLVSPLESRVVAPNDIRTVESEILINADAQTIWDHIIRVAYITPEEQHFDLFHLAGIPSPTQATLDREGVGGIRHGMFDNGLMFIETINDWQPLQTISFNIHVRGSVNIPAPFNEIGGRVFSILSARYTLEPIGDHQVLLHLSSQHRLSTNFNFYGGLWTDWMLHDFQDYVLGIVKARCEGTQ